MGDANEFRGGILDKMLDKIEFPAMMESSVKRKMQQDLEDGQQAMAKFLWNIFDENDDNSVTPDDVLAACTKADKVSLANDVDNTGVALAKDLFSFTCSDCAKEVPLGKPFAKAFKKFKT